MSESKPLSTSIARVALFSSLFVVAPCAAQSASERLDGILAGLASADAAIVERAGVALDALCVEVGRPDAERERRAFALLLSKNLGSGLGVAVETVLLEKLVTIGGVESVPYLSKVLLDERADPAVREVARRALESNPNPRAKSELRKAAGRVVGDLRAAVCRSLGARRDLLALGALMEAVRSDDRDVRIAAVEAMAAIGDEQCVAPVEEALEAAGERDVAAMRRAYLRLAHELVVNDTRGMARRLYVRAMAMGPEYRAAALIGVAEAGLQSEVPKIVAALVDPDLEVRGAAAQAAVRIGGPAMTPALVARLEAAPPAEEQAILEVLARRRDATASSPVLGVLPRLEGAASRRAALEVIAAADDESAVRALFAALAENSEIAEKAEELLGLTGAGSADALLADALARSRGEARARFVRIVGSRRSAGGAQALFDAGVLGDPDPLVRGAAFAALARIGGASAFDALLGAASSVRSPEDGTACARALRAIDVEDRSDRLIAAFDAASGPSRAVLLGALRGTSDPRVIERLRAAASSSSADERRAAAEGLAASGDVESVPVLFDLASRLPDARRDEAVSIYRRVLELDVDVATARQCVDRLRKLGVEVDPARERGSITCWWIAGPFESPGGALFSAVLSPERGPVDLGLAVVHGDETRRWKRHHEGDPFGVVTLDDALASRGEIGAYLWSEITLEADVDAILRIGSDDQVVCFVDGKQVHSFAGERSVSPDQDSVPVRLAAGVHTVLLKVLNAGGGWGACLRITDRDGKPLAFAQREK